jgi:ribonucleoside-triphosphate reductase
MTELAEIEAELSELKARLPLVKGRETEVYDRIVGYYRPVKNWNPGMTQNQKERVRFDMPKEVTCGNV